MFNYKPEILRENFGNYIVPPETIGTIAIDIGCNNGGFLKKYINHFSEIHAYEPNTYLFNLLKEKYKKNNHVHLYNEALYHSPKHILSLVKYNHNDEDGSFACFTENTQEYWKLTNKICEVTTVDIETIIGRCSSKNIGYLKIDCETGEYDGLNKKDLSPFNYIGIELHCQLSQEKYTELYDYISITHNCGTPCNRIVGLNQELLFKKRE